MFARGPRVVVRLGRIAPSWSVCEGHNNCVCGTLECGHIIYIELTNRRVRRVFRGGGGGALEAAVPPAPATPAGLGGRAFLPEMVLLLAALEPAGPRPRGPGQPCQGDHLPTDRARLTHRSPPASNLPPMISCKEIGPPHWGSLLDEGSCPALTCRWGPSFQPHACNPPFIACRILDAAPRMPVPSTYHCVEVHTVDCSMCPEPIPQARLDVAPHCQSPGPMGQSSPGSLSHPVGL